jgi:hypothetical protein
MGCGSSNDVWPAAYDTEDKRKYQNGVVDFEFDLHVISVRQPVAQCPPRLAGVSISHVLLFIVLISIRHRPMCCS